MLLLSYEAKQKGYRSNGWLTFKQIKKLGGSIIKGHKATPIMFWDPRFKDQDGNWYSKDEWEQLPADKRAKCERVARLRYHLVFNVNQTQGLGDAFYEVEKFEDLPTITKNKTAENLISRTGAKFRFYGDQAYYTPSTDSIALPNPNKFKGTEPFYSVLFHELCHWTGHKDRLNRDFSEKFGSKEYALEELVAELGSAYICTEIGMTLPITQNAAYIQNWLTVLRNDKTFIFKASAQAEKAARFIREARAPKVDADQELEATTA